MHRKCRKEKQKKRNARKARVARQTRGSSRPRLTVFRSAKHIYAQLVDPETGRTIGGVSTRSGTVMADAAATGNVEAAKRVGRAVAELARQNQIETVVFNRNGFLYHGRVKALAEAAREAGLQF
jgi:large subunit ribosomal protein L18